MEGEHLAGLVLRDGGQFFCPARGSAEGSVSRRGPPPEEARESWRTAAARRTSSPSWYRGLAASREPRHYRFPG